MMAVVVNHRDAARLPPHLKPAIDARITRDGLADRFERNVELQADRDRRGSVQNVVHARNMQRKLAQILFAIAHPESAQRLPMAPHQASCFASIQFDVKVRAALGSISQSAPLHAWQQPPQ